MGGAETVVFDQGDRRSSCGYCRSLVDLTSISHYLWADSITVDDYQELLDRGWRRSGTILYKPEMESTCCPLYTIRLKAGKFTPSNEQVRVLKKMQRFLDGTLDLKREHQLKGNVNFLEGFISQGSHSSSKASLSESKTEGNEQVQEEDRYINVLASIVNNAVSTCIENGELPANVQLPKALTKKVIPQAKKKLVKMSENLLYTSSISFQIVAVLRQSKVTLASNANQSGEYSNLSPNIVAEKLVCSMNQIGLLSDMSVKACNGHLNFYSSTQIDSVVKPITRDRSMHPIKDNGADIKHGHKLEGSSTEPHIKHKLEIRMRRSSFDPEEYELYRRYQIKVHNDEPNEVSEISYRSFLVDTPLIFCPPHSSREVLSCGFGSFHQQYLIDGKLVAVGVVDILPKCLSSKYLFWDPEFAFLSLGKFSALKEIDWVKETQVQCQSLQYYYLGYYIHSCQKMRYKAAYLPSELLCPLRYQWVPFHIAKPLLDKKSYVVLSDFETIENGEPASGGLSLSSTMEQFSDPEGGLPSHSDNDEEKLDIVSEDEVGVDDEDINNTLIDFEGRRMRFEDLQQVLEPINRTRMKILKLQLHRYVKVVGSRLAVHMIYCL